MSLQRAVASTPFWPPRVDGSGSSEPVKGELNARTRRGPRHEAVCSGFYDPVFPLDQHLALLSIC